MRFEHDTSLRMAFMLKTALATTVRDAAKIGESVMDGRTYEYLNKVYKEKQLPKDFTPYPIKPLGREYALPKDLNYQGVIQAVMWRTRQIYDDPALAKEVGRALDDIHRVNKPNQHKDVRFESVDWWAWPQHVRR